MKNLLSLFFLGLLLISMGCMRETPNTNDSNSAELEINFRATFGSEPLLMFARDYEYPSIAKVKMQLFQFYLSDIALIEEGTGKVVPFQDVALINFKDVMTDAAAAAGISLKVKVPKGNYTALRMGLGVSPTLNATDPGNYTPPHPLDDNYWTAATGYIFSKIEGNADLDGQGTFAEKLTFHTGANSLYQEKTFNTNFTVGGNTPAPIQLDVDVRRMLMVSESDFLDFRTVTQDHTNDVDVYGYISDNFFEAIQLR